MNVDELKEAQDRFLLPSLRERFAIAALPGILAQRSGYTDAAEIAREAFAIADAMLAASEGAPPSSEVTP